MPRYQDIALWLELSRCGCDYLSFLSFPPLLFATYTDLQIYIAFTWSFQTGLSLSRKPHRACVFPRMLPRNTPQKQIIFLFFIKYFTSNYKYSDATKFPSFYIQLFFRHQALKKVLSKAIEERNVAQIQPPEK